MDGWVDGWTNLLYVCTHYMDVCMYLLERIQKVEGGNKVIETDGLALNG